MDIFSNISSVNKKYDINANETQKIAQKSQELKNIEVKKNEDDFANKSKEEIKKELQKIIEELNKAMNPLNQDLKFQFNDKVDELIVQVVDKKNDLVVREFPPKEALHLMERMRELVGLLFDKKG